MKTATQYDSQLSLDEELNPQVKQWILRILVPLGGMSHLINPFNGDYSNERLAAKLGLLDYEADVRNSEDGRQNKKENQNAVRQLYILNAHQHFDPPVRLRQNIIALSKITPLSAIDCQLLEFVALSHFDDSLNTVCNYVGKEIRADKLFRSLSVILDQSEHKIRQALDSDSILSRSGLLKIEDEPHDLSVFKLKIFSRRLVEILCNGRLSADELLRGKVYSSPPAKLTLSDYPCLKNELAVLLPYLQHCVAEKTRGVNILIYGLPGTGKTELVRLIAQLIACELCEIANEDERNQAQDWQDRLDAYRLALCFFIKKKKLILFDEVEDIFCNKQHDRGAGKYKAWMNFLLENNEMPTFWISNQVDSIDAAFARRFDFVFEVPLPDKAQREELIRRYSMDLMGEPSIKRMANAERLSPAMIERSARVVSSIASVLDNTGQAMEMLLNNTLKVQGEKSIDCSQKAKVPEVYDPAFIHADTDMLAIAEGLAKHGTGRLCLYGPPGTGKTAYAYWLAETLEKPLIIQRASDLLSMFVGGTEHNLASAFAEAEQQKAILMMDEVDSFLQDRRSAQRGREVSQVNEMLTQMESFDGIFIASSNLMESLDPAALRRFDLKAKFGFLLPEQAWQLFCRYCETLQIDVQPSATRQRLSQAKNLTTGDFAAVFRQSRFNPFKNSKEFIQALLAEAAMRQPAEKRIGFVYD